MIESGASHGTGDSQGCDFVHRPDLDDIADALRTMIQATDRYRSAVAELVGTDQSVTLALTYLTQTDHLNARDLAARVAITPAAMTALIDRLENAGLAQRSRHPHDRRQTIVTATDHGRRTLHRIRLCTYNAIDRLPEDQHQALTGTLAAFAVALIHESKLLSATDRAI